MNTLNNVINYSLSFLIMQAEVHKGSKVGSVILFHFRFLLHMSHFWNASLSVPSTSISLCCDAALQETKKKKKKRGSGK